MSDSGKRVVVLDLDGTQGACFERAEVYRNPKEYRAACRKLRLAA